VQVLAHFRRGNGIDSELYSAGSALGEGRDSESSQRDYVRPVGAHCLSQYGESRE